MSRKKWCIAKYNKDHAAQIAEDFNLNPITALLLLARGFESDDDIYDFLDEDELLENPFHLIDMDKAVARIQKAIDNFERIVVYGDYDADGVTATALLYSYLESQGANVFFHIPERCTEGYGLNIEAIDQIKAQGANLIITVDNGVNAIEEAIYINALGMDLVITDHHQVSGELPAAVAVIDPHRKDCPSYFKDLAGVGVAFKLISALEGDSNDLLNQYADIITIGTIADIVPLKGDNRKIVRFGLNLINSKHHIGIEAIRESAGLADKILTSTNVAFNIAPRINAAGRMGSAERTLKLLLSEDYEQAQELAQELEAANQMRQQTELEILESAKKQIEENAYRYDRVIVVDGQNWHQGVIGIVASRIAERYGRPCLVITNDGITAKGSGRSIEGFSLFDALKATSDLLTHFGGHTLAAGFGIQPENINAFRKAINAYAATQEMPYPMLKLDCKLNPASITMDILTALEELEPFGSENPQPVFGLYNMKIEAVEPIGNNKHIRIKLSKGTTNITAVRFGVTCSDYPFKPGDLVDLAVKIDANEFMGEKRVSLLVRDERPANADDDVLIKYYRIYEKHKRQEPLTKEEIELAFPTRELMAKVYKHIKANDGWRYSAEVFCYRLNNTVNPCAVMIAFDVMCELGLVVAYEDGKLALPPETIKVNLDDSKILNTLERQRKVVSA